jgi:hypothetical protein
MRILRTSGFVFLVLTFASPVLAEESNVVSGVGASSCGSLQIPTRKILLELKLSISHGRKDL